MDEWINNVLYPSNRILLNLEKEGNSGINYNIDEPQGHYSKWNKPNTDRQIVYDITFAWNLKIN